MNTIEPGHALYYPVMGNWNSIGFRNKTGLPITTTPQKLTEDELFLYDHEGITPKLTFFIEIPGPDTLLKQIALAVLRDDSVAAMALLDKLNNGE